MDSSVRDRQPLIRVHISSTMLFTWNFQPAMETATLIIFSVFQYPVLVMLKDGDPVIVEWFPAKSTTVSVVSCVFFVWAYSSRCSSNPHLPIIWSSSGLSWRACRIAVCFFSTYGWVKYTDAPNGFPNTTSLEKPDDVLLSESLPVVRSLCFKLLFLEGNNVTIFHIFPAWEAPECFVE